jgi:hypothetical protein
MDGKLWKEIYHKVMMIEYPNPTEKVTHSDRVIVLVKLRARADNQPVSWACRAENWAGLRRPQTLPSQPTMSRRLRTTAVKGLLDAIEEWLRTFGKRDDRVRIVDGRPLTISPYSKDPEARWGYALKGLGFGYKIHAIWGSAPVPEAWALRPMNASESTVAECSLTPSLPLAKGRRYIVGDRSFDTNRLYGALANRGYQLLAPPKRPGKNLGHRPHDPARVYGLALLATPYGRKMYRQRGRIERLFGNWTVRSEGLSELPAHVRRQHRVRQFVQAKIILNGFRIMYNRQTNLSRAA